MIFPPDPAVSFLTGTRGLSFYFFSCWPFLAGLLLSKKMIWGTAGEADRVYTVDENVFFFSSSSIFLSRLFSYSHPSAELWTLCWPHLVAGLWRVGRLICVYKESSSCTELIQLPLHTVVYIDERVAAVESINEGARSMVAVHFLYTTPPRHI